MVDKSISFGNQNFLFIKADETGLIYDYVASMTKKGSILIGCFTKDGNTALYWLGKGPFANVWAARVGLEYVLPSELKDPNIA